MKGRVLAGKYRLVHELGRGGMGSVWRAEHVDLRSPVAIKLIDPALAETREGQSRFLREARAASALRSTHVVSVFDYGVDEGTPFLVMELLEGESLAQRLERRVTLELSEVQEIIRQVARGLSRAHAAGIVHRDLKPENVFITTEADSELVKLLDFGIAKVDANIAVSVQTQTGMVLGTPYYMSPEQAEGRRELDARSDIWSLGVIVYECLLGKRPFDGDNLAQIILAICADPLPVPSREGPVPDGFDAWFRRVACRRIEERCSTVQELSEGLSHLSADWGRRGVIAREARELDAGSAAVGKQRATTEAEPASPRVAADNPAEQARAETDDAGARAVFASSGVHHAGKVNTPPSKGVQFAVGILVLAAAALLGVGGWYWSGGGTLVAEAPSATYSELTPSLEVGARPPDEPSAVTGRSDNVSSPAPSGTFTSPVGALGGAPEVDRTPSPRTGAVAASPPTLEPTVSGATTAGAGSRAAVRPAGPPPSVEEKKSPVSATYCTHNAISGRLVRASPGKPGSFPCYVNSISGEYRKKE